MINAVRRCINLFVIVAFVLGAVSFHSVHEVRAQGFTTPPQINGIFNPDTIYPSQTTRLTINVFNPNVSQLTEVHWMNHLPDDLIVVDPPNPLVTGCGGSYLLDATPGNDYISISAATTDGTTDPVNPGVCSVTVSVTSFDPGNHTNVIDRDTDGGYLLNGVSGLYEYDANITLLVLDMSAPDVDKSFSPDLINEGENSQLTITIQNTDSTVALTQVSLTDNFPAGLSVSDTSVSLSNCGSGTLNPIAIDDTSIHLSNATIATGATCTIRVNVKTSGTGTFTNVIHPADLTNYQQVTIPSNVSDDLVVENLELDKSFSPDNFQVGTGYSTLSISITNPDAINPLTNVHFTDTMDPDVTVVPGFSSVSGTGCSGDIVDTNPASLSVNNGVIPAGGTCVFSARVESNVVGSHPNTISCSDITFDGGTAGCQSASDTLNVYDTGLGLGVVKSFSSSNVAPGQDNGMTIEITAPGDTDLTNFSLTDNFPAGVLLYRPEPSHEPNFSQSGCGAGTFAALPSDMGFTFSGGTILAGTTCRLQVNVVSSVYGPHTNTIHPGDIDNSENRNISGDVSATFTVRDISITKSFASSIVGRNGITTLTLNVINNYSVPVTNINFTDTLPGTVDNGIIIATPSNLSTTCTGSVTTGAQSITLTDGELAASQRCTITVDVQGTSTSAPPPGTTYTNRIEIGGVTGRVNGTTLTQNWHAASAGITVGSPDFRINKKFDPILVTGDTASTMTITLVNTESSPVSEIAFTDTLPTHMLLAVPPNPTTGTCGGTITPAADRMSFTYSGGSLAGRTQCQLTIRAMMEVTGNLINTIPALSVSTRQGMTNHDPTSATLTNLSSVGVRKHFDPNPVSPGGVSTIFLDIEKIGIGIGLTGLGLSDTLLYGLEVASPSNATNTCGGSLVANPGSTNITLSGGAMPIGTDTCTISVDVLVPSSGLRSGGYENCIPIGTVVTDQGYTNVIEACDTLGNLFDPPTGRKVFDSSGLPLLEWQMVWINDHNSAAIDAQVRDTIPAGTTYVPGSLTCEERGSSSRSTDPLACTYIVASNEVFWSGTIGPDRGAVDEATANNEVVITFLVSVPDALNLVNNQAPSLTDTDGDGDFADETTSASESISNRSTWYRFARPGRGTTGIDIDAKILPASGFAPGLRTNLNGKPDGIYRTYNALDMEIPKLGLKTSILGLSALNGKWDVSWLGDRLAYLHESAFPTWEGNSVITGHVYNSDGNPGPFNQLHTLHYGDRIVIHAYDQVYLYEVREMQAVSPDDIESTFKHQKNSWITLLTCQGYNPDRGEYDSRLLVRAVLMEKQ